MNRCRIMKKRKWTCFGKGFKKIRYRKVQNDDHLNENEYNVPARKNHTPVCYISNETNGYHW